MRWSPRAHVRRSTSDMWGYSAARAAVAPPTAPPLCSADAPGCGARARRADLEFIRAQVDKTAIERLEAVASTPFERITYTRAIEILQEVVAAKKKKFEFQVRPGARARGALPGEACPVGHPALPTPPGTLLEPHGALWGGASTAAPYVEALRVACAARRSARLVRP